MADWLSARRLTMETFDLQGKTLGIVGFGDTGSLGQMRPQSRLICSARGGIVDESALADALRAGRIRNGL